MKKRTVLKDHWFIFMVLIVIIALLGPAFRPVLRQAGAAGWQIHAGEPVVRLHVRAAGDSPAEQRFKMALAARVRQLLSENSPPEAGKMCIRDRPRAATSFRFAGAAISSIRLPCCMITRITPVFSWDYFSFSPVEVAVSRPWITPLTERSRLATSLASPAGPLIKSTSRQRSLSLIHISTLPWAGRS